MEKLELNLENLQYINSHSNNCNPAIKAVLSLYSWTRGKEKQNHEESALECIRGIVKPLLPTTLEYKKGVHISKKLIANRLLFSRAENDYIGREEYLLVCETSSWTNEPNKYWIEVHRVS